MTIEQARSVFLWCSVLNIAILLTWVVLATAGREWLLKFTTRFFRVTPEQSDLLNLAGITLYKMAVLLFNIVPCVALFLAR
jgi:NADH:ubiquinone oxidoreductase subunit B-like Fe-S oxidoreductase